MYNFSQRGLVVYLLRNVTISSNVTIQSTFWERLTSLPDALALLGKASPHFIIWSCGHGLEERQRTTRREHR